MNALLKFKTSSPSEISSRVYFLARKNPDATKRLLEHFGTTQNLIHKLPGDELARFNNVLEFLEGTRHGPPTKDEYFIAWGGYPDEIAKGQSPEEVLPAALVETSGAPVVKIRDREIISPSANTEYPAVTNADFLAKIFQGINSGERCWVTSFRENPAKARGEWKGQSCRPMELVDSPDTNNYFSVAVFKDGADSRTYEHFVSLRVLVLDDPEKVDLAPTWLLRTSPGKVQAGYRLSEPVKDLEIAKRLHNQLANAGHIPADHSGNNAVRYVRLPVGVNSKHDPPFPCVLEIFEPERAYSLAKLLDGLGLDADYILSGRLAQPPKPVFGEREPDGMIPEGARNATLTSLAGTMRRRGMSQEAIEAALLVENARRCALPLPVDEVRAIARSVARYAPEAGGTENRGVEPYAAGWSGLKLISAAEVMQKAGPIEWLVEDYIEADALIQIFGEPGSYKSFLSLGLACAVASGFPWQGKKSKKGLVVYVCGEGQNGMGRRLTAWRQHHGGEVDLSLLRISSRAVGLTDDEQAAALAEQVDEAVKATGQTPMLFVIDTLARNYGGADENSTADMGRFIQHVDAIRKPFGASAVVVHHSGHNNAERERGSSALRGAIDANFRVEVKDRLVTLTCLKMKDAELAPPLLLEPKTVELEGVVDADGSPVTSVVLVAGSDVKAAAIRKFHAKYPKLAQRSYTAALMEALCDTDGTTSIRKLAGKVGCKSSTVSDTLALLREYGLIESTTWLLTEEGRSALAWVSHRPDILFNRLKPPYRGVFGE